MADERSERHGAAQELAVLREENRRLRADLAAQRDAHAAVQELLLAYTRAIPDVSLILDEDGRYLEALGDPALLARPPSDVLGRTVCDVFPGPIGEAFLTVIRAAARTGQVQSTEYELDVPSGQRWFESRVVRLETQRDGKWHVLWLSWDITARREADARLQQQTELLTTVFDHIPLFIDLFDGEGRFLLINRAWEEVLGYSLEDAQRENVLFRLVPEPEEQKRVLDVMLEKKPGWHSFRITTKSDRVLDTVWTNVALSDGRSIGIGQDVTEQKKLEARFWQAQKLESIGRLAGGVAHDFNNMLTAILGYAELLSSQLLPSASSADLGEIIRAAERARELTRQLLAFARRQVIAPKVLELGALARDMERLLHRLLGASIELELRSPPSPWPVLADAAQLEQVILNLAINARDAMPSGGKLVIETANVDRPPATITEFAGPCVRLSVIDSGEGIAPELLDHLFEPFFTTKKPGEGTGLGLATVHGIIVQSGGRIAVTSAPGKGTRFDIYLPRTAAPEAEEPPPVEARAADHRGTVLVVEDEPQVQRLVVRALERAGWTVLRAANGVEALAVAEAHGDGIDLLVTDVVMPKMNGRELATVLAGQRPQLATLFVSGYSEEMLQHGLGEGRAAFLSKPFTSQQLVSKVQALLTRASAAGSAAR